MDNLKVGIDVEKFLSQIVVQIQNLVFLNQVSTQMSEKKLVLHNDKLVLKSDNLVIMKTNWRLC